MFKGLQGCNESGCNGHGECVNDVCECNEFGNEGDEDYWKYEGEFCEIGEHISYTFNLKQSLVFPYI